MHRKLVLILLISLKLTCLHANDLVNILVSGKNFFHKINSQLHILTNKIFKSLNLGLEFNKDPKTQGLLAMHDELTKIAEEYGYMFSEIQKATAVKLKPNETYGLKKVFEELIEEETKQYKTKTIQDFTVDTIPAKNNATNNDEFEKVIDKLLEKDYKLSNNDIEIVSNETINTISKKNTTTKNTSREIQLWQPQVSAEDKGNYTRRIFKGKKTRIKKYPFLVSIHINNEFLCSGSIISKDLVLTAGTCLQTAYHNDLIRDNVSSIFVRAGSDFTNRNGELIPIIEAYFHPDYDSQTLRNNLVIIRMKRRLKFSKKRRIKRIQYDRDETDFTADVRGVTVLGWGDTGKENNQYENQSLSAARLDIYATVYCKEIYTRYYVTDKHFCAGFESKGGGACNRDVGGPGIVAKELVGIVSFGPSICGTIDAPTVFTKLGNYADWIDSIVNQKTQPIIVETTEKTTKIRQKVHHKSLLITPTPLHSHNKTHLRTRDIKKLDDTHNLKETLQEIVLTNSSVLDYILYSDAPEDDEANDKRVKAVKKYLHHHPQVKHEILLIQKQKMLQRQAEKTTENNVPSDDTGSDYDETDTAIQILESLAGDTQKVRIDKKKVVAKTTTQLINRQAVMAVTPGSKNTFMKATDDSKSYYEEGISIEEYLSPFKTKVSSIKNIYKVRPTKPTTHKTIRLEDYKNIIVNLGKGKETRNIIKINKQKIGGNKKRTMISDDESDIKTSMNDERPVGRMKTLGVDTSNDDKDSNAGGHSTGYSHDYKSNGDDEAEPMLWRFRREE